MEKLEQFKTFVKNNPSLINYVKNNEMTWQKFYELYDIYGEKNEIWNDYIKKETTKLEPKQDIMSLIKGINLDSFQEGLNSVQRVLGLLSDISSNNSVSSSEIKPRPIYKHFDD